jgi:hypothetical protein
MIIALSGAFIFRIPVSSQTTGNAPAKPAQKNKKVKNNPSASPAVKPINIQTEIKLLKAKLAVLEKLEAQGKSTISPQAGGSCSNSATPCCCQVGSPPAACMTKADCDDIGGRCVPSGIGCD